MKVPANIKEPSTMAGAAAIAGGINETFQLVEPSTADAIGGAAAQLIMNPTPMGLAMTAFGLFSIFMREKGGS